MCNFINILINLVLLALVLCTTAAEAIGITAGAHRLWTHRAYKAKWPLRIILLIWYTLAGQVNKFLIDFCARVKKFSLQYFF